MVVSKRTKVPWRFKLHFFCKIVIRCKELEFTFKDLLEDFQSTESIRKSFSIFFCERSNNLMRTVWKWKWGLKHYHEFDWKINIFPVKSTFLLKKLLITWFHGKICTVRRQMWKNFREIKFFSENVDLTEKMVIFP